MSGTAVEDCFVAVTVLMPKRLADAALRAAETCGQRTAADTIRLEHFVILSEKSFERLLEGQRLPEGGWQRTGPGWALDADCGGAGEGPERAANPAPVAGTVGVPAMT